MAKVRAPSVGDLSIKSYAGKYVVLDFFTYGCVNCLNNIATIKALHVKYSESVIIIGIHSPKFTREKEKNALVKFIEAMNLEYEIIEDIEHKILDNYAIKAWPTTLIIDESGYIVESFSGELTLGFLEQKLQVYTSLHVKHSKEKKPEPQNLCFPKALTCSDEFIVISNTSAHSLILLSYDAKVIKVIEDITYPLGSYVFEGYIYVVSENSLFKIDTKTYKKEKILSNLRSPSDVIVLPDMIIISSMASHKILFFSKETLEQVDKVGNGFEALRDGALDEAQLAQPMAMEMFDDRLFFVDAESSSLRYMNALHVETLIGEGLFTFGDSNEDEILLQHPQDICVGKVFDGCGAGRIFIADTYNNKMKVYDAEAKSMMTLLENLHAPSAIDKKGCKLYIADTNAHKILCFDISSMCVDVFYETP